MKNYSVCSRSQYDIDPQPWWVLVAEWIEGRIRYRKYWTGTEYVIAEDIVM